MQCNAFQQVTLQRTWHGKACIAWYTTMYTAMQWCDTAMPLCQFQSHRVCFMTLISKEGLPCQLLTTKAHETKVVMLAVHVFAEYHSHSTQAAKVLDPLWTMLPKGCLLSTMMLS